MKGEVIVELLLGASRRHSKIANADGYYGGIVIIVKNAHLMDPKSIKIFDKISEHLDRTSFWLVFSLSTGMEKRFRDFFMKIFDAHYIPLVSDLDPTLARMVLVYLFFFLLLLKIFWHFKIVFNAEILLYYPCLIF